jgi:hypothetical protein
VGRYGRAARDAGQLWDANLLESLAQRARIRIDGHVMHVITQDGILWRTLPCPIPPVRSHLTPKIGHRERRTAHCRSPDDV